MSDMHSTLPENAVAIIGMAGRFPGAATVEAFWKNLVDGVDSITRFSPEESEDRRAAGKDSSAYVAARGVLEGVEFFDAEYFGIPPREAERIDPQHRVFLEVCAHALEDAGYVPEEYTEEIGLFAGCSLNTYLLANLCTDRAFIDELTSNYQVGEFSSALGNDKDFLTTRVAYKLNLRGPCMTVQGACATSLVAVAQACQALLTYQCGMALAGGVSITFPQKRGHMHQDGAISSQDGYCRPFDANATGTVFGHGAGVVVLKRLEDAIRDGDHIEAVIRGFAVNNDGAQKAGYMAPGVNGQARVISMAQAMADVSPDSITYVEAHGTGTPMGDPIEIAALTQAFGEGTSRHHYCTVGAVKGNVGHLDSAAGVTGLIKTTLSFKHRTLPGLLHFQHPNPNLALENSPFLFTAETKPWIADGPLRAGVSAFGVGGVNAHVVLEEPPVSNPSKPLRNAYPICLSARTQNALAQMKMELAAFLEQHRDASLADVAYTLACGRKAQPQRFAAVVTGIDSAIAALRGAELSPVEDSEVVSLATQWQAGERVDWSAFFHAEARHRISLPVTPFQRTKHWIDAPEHATSKETLTMSSPVSTLDVTPSIEPASRLPRLQKQAADVLFDLSGIEITPAEYEASFFELGFDSLFLTQASSSIEKAFGVKVSFRQLMEDVGTVSDLATYLDAAMPADLPAPASAPAPIAVAASAAAPGSVEQMLQAQIAQLSDLFKAQVDALRVAAGGVASAPIAAVKVETVVAATAPAAAETTVRHGSFRTPQTRGKEELNSTQQTYIDDLIAAYIAKTPTSKQITQASRPRLADPRAVAGFRPQWKEMVYPLVTDRAKGSRIWDLDGNEYIDIVNGYGCIMFGHSPDFVVEAVKKQIDLGVAIGPQSHLAGQVADLITQLTGNERVSFCNTGSEAVMAAMRVARMITNRDKVVYFVGDYHGTFDEVLARKTPRGTLPIAPGIPTASLGNIVVLDYGTEESLQYLRENGQEIAAVLVEPVQTRHPDLQPIEFLRTVRTITESTGTAMIIDEVVTGFRLAPGGVQQAFGIRADLCTYGKVIGGGYPIGVLSGKARFMDALDGGMWQYGDDSVPEAGVTFFAGTFVRHPQAMAAAHAVLHHLIDAGPALQQTLNEKTARLAASIDRMFQERGVPCRVHSFASWFYFIFPPDAKLAPLFYYAMRIKGVHIQESYPCFLTTSHTDADLERIEAAFRSTIAEMQAALVMPQENASVIAAEPVWDDAVTDVPLTEPQREIFLAAALGDEANCAFNESLSLHLKGSVRRDALQLAMDTVLSRHDALRAVITEDGEHLHVQPAWSGAVTWIDVAGYPSAEQKHAVQTLIAQDAATPFDLHCGPLVRVTAFLISAEEVHLVLTAHHIVLDGWSSNQLVAEIGTLYSKGMQAVTTLQPVMPFRQYAQLELSRSKAGAFAANEAYWVDQFAGRSPRLDLPTDYPRPVNKTYAGATFDGRLEDAVMDAARQLGRKNGCSLFVTLLSSFQMLLHRLTQQDEVVVGISTAGQALVEGKTLVGHCVHFLPMLSTLQPDETVQQHLRATRTKMLDAQDHQEFTYGSLLQKITLERDASRLPLIEVQFNLEKAGDVSLFEGLESSVHSNAKAYVNTDLFLNVIETKDGTVYTLDYNTDLFTPATISRWMALWSQLLLSEAEDVTSQVTKLAILPASELDEVLHRWNHTATDFGPFASVPVMVEQQAKARPDAIAVECYGRAWTYAELMEYATLVARRLVHEGLKPGELVGVCIERSLEMAGSLLAVMMAGGAYVPLDPRHPHERLEGILADAHISMLLTGRDPKVTASKMMNVTGPQPSLQATLPSASSADALAYVIYTSGSTGTPKGVAIPHRALTNLLLSMQREPGMQQQDAWLAVTTLAFDIATLELLLPLITGARLVIATEEEATDGNQLRQLIDDKKITILQATPGLWRIVLDAGLTSMPTLKVLCGGEALPRDLADQLLALSPDVWNVYGPTETTIWSAAGLVTAGHDAPRIGLPIANTQFYVLTEGDQPAPLGVVGELVIGGQGLADGYWNRVELTAEKFIANPFGPGRIYRTGDLARRYADGSIEVLGRSDFQVKVRGYRIELGDIEAAMRKHPQVREAVVLTSKEAGAASTALVGFIESQQALDEASRQSLMDDLQSLLLRSLPEYMVPNQFVVLDTIPRTPNGKIDRKSLIPLLPSTAREREVVPPSTEEESKLAAIWIDLLHVPSVSVTDSIFELGADSLAIFRIAARCQRDGLPVKAADIFKHRTIAALAAQLAEQPANTASASSSPRIKPVARDRFKVTKVVLDA